MNVLAVVAHPDDEILGCGATLARHAALGDNVHVLILAEGVTSRAGQRDRSAHAHALSELGAAAQRAGKAVGASSVTLHDLPDNRMDTVDLLGVVKIVESHVERTRPHVVYTHHAGDLNVDHQVTHRAVITACRPLPASSLHALLFFEVCSSTEWAIGQPFAPNWFVDVSAHLADKLVALDVYASEMRPWPHPRSREAVEALARWRGATAGVDAAEAFVLGRAVRALPGRPVDA